MRTRIATYNLWNHPYQSAQRLDAACETLHELGADVVALQEVGAAAPSQPGRSVAHYIGGQLGYPHMWFASYPNDEGEGLAFLSRLPVRAASPNCGRGEPVLRALRLEVLIGDMPVGFTNVHLNSYPVPFHAREREAVDIVKWLSLLSHCAHEVLCGDFNSYGNSSIHRFLTGRQSLLGWSAEWFDVAEFHAYRTGTSPLATLDFSRNPRWANQHTLETPARFDWILIRNSYPEPHPLVHRVELFGAAPAPKAVVVPSDHYGVSADIEFR
jgi:endonuclease/exonuclease/phosphatase family metal-dependent hydrolase